MTRSRASPASLRTEGEDGSAGAPAITLRSGFSDNGLSVGIRFAKAIGGEAQLLALAYQLGAALER